MHTRKHPHDIGLAEALSMVLGSVNRLRPMALPMEEVCGLVAAEDLLAVADCPSGTSSLKDGYAVMSKDLDGASDDQPVRLRVVGVSVAGKQTEKRVTTGLAIEVLTGAIVPEGADAVIPIEFTRREGETVFCQRDAGPGRNVLPLGSDVGKDERVVSQGEILRPALVGLLAAGGAYKVPVFPMPRVGIVSTGDEVVAPGRPLKPGQLYASNLVTLMAWLRHFGMEGKGLEVKDLPEEIREAMATVLSDAEVLLTSGGAWKSDRDLTVKILDEMGWAKVFHRVRMGPGKAVAMGMLHGKPVFCLPGGPPSNEMAFLQLALPGLLQMAGRSAVPFRTREVRLASPVGGDVTWTQFFQATFEKRKKEWWVVPLRIKSRLQSQARADALIKVPEGVKRLEAGALIEVQVLFSVDKRF